MSRQFAKNTILCSFCLIGIFASFDSHAQDTPSQYRWVEKTIYDQRPVKESKWVEETVYEKKTITEYKQVFETEQRQKRVVVRKPVTRQVEKVEKHIVRKPVTETRYRTRETEETIIETVTEMRDRDYIIETPVYQTEMRDETTVVRKPITEQVIRNDHVTTYRPVIAEQDQPVLANLQIAALVPFLNPNDRPRLKWLQRGYHTDNVTGQTVYRHRGLHWVREPQPGYQLQTTNVPVIANQRTQQLAYLPETRTIETPVDVTRYVETVERRQVPVTVKKVERKVETRKVPVTVRRPKTVVRTEQIPYTETRFVDTEVETRIPVKETYYETEERFEPYEVTKAKWVPITKTIEVPKTVRRKVEVELIQHTPRRVTMKIPVDQNGNPINTGSPQAASVNENPKRNWKTVQQRVPGLKDKAVDETSSRQEKSILNKSQPATNEEGGPATVPPDTDSSTDYQEYHAYPGLRRLGVERASETSQSADQPRTAMRPIWRPESDTAEAETGSQDATVPPEPRVQPPSRSMAEPALDANSTGVEKSPAPRSSPSSDDS